ncbi:MAG: OmpH family outer membrane protein [Sodaliphilus sp.]
MMKRVMLLLVALLPICAWAQSQKIAVVDVVSIYNACPEKDSAEHVLANLSAQYQKEYKLMQDDFGKKYAEFQRIANDPSVAPTIKERRIQEIQDEDEKVKQFVKTVDKELAQKKAELKKPILAKIHQAIKAVGEEVGYTYIFDVSQTPLLYQGADAINLTPLIKEKLGLK